MTLTPSRLITATIIWAVLGFCFSVFQFTLCEITYRIATYTEHTFLYDASNAIAWPAGEIYDLVEEVKIKNAFSTVADSGEAGAEKATDFLHDFSKKFKEDDEWTTSLWTYIEAQEIETEVGAAMEYLIYGGVCLAWGFLIFLGGSLFTLFTMRLIPESKTTGIEQIH